MPAAIDVRIEGHAHVIVGAEKDRALAVADRDGRAFDLLHHQVERVDDAAFEQGLALLDQRVELGEKVGHAGRCQPHQGIDQLADGFDLRLHVHRDDDVELVLDVGDEIEHREAVPLEILGEAGCFGDRDALLVVGLDEVEDLV